MSFWFWHGLKAGIQTTRYPRRPDIAAGISTGRPVDTEFALEADAQLAAAICPVEAIEARAGSTRIDHGKCIQCQRCRLELATPMNWEAGYEWARTVAQPGGASPVFPSAFSRSLHIMVVDAGDCGACLHEVNQLNNPLYNMHRLGFFFTATPRAADLLLVVGPVSENTRGPLLKTWEAMPSTRRVMAVGNCAISGGVFGHSFICAGGVPSVLPIDFEVPGDPPPPLAILHGLLVATGRKSAIREKFVSEGRS
jgi:Ni,Fe-hydrogenase III small subunit/ferredoxin-like protein FixX